MPDNPQRVRLSDLSDTPDVPAAAPVQPTTAPPAGRVRLSELQEQPKYPELPKGLEVHNWKPGQELPEDEDEDFEVGNSFWDTKEQNKLAAEYNRQLDAVLQGKPYVPETPQISGYGSKLTSVMPARPSVFPQQQPGKPLAGQLGDILGSFPPATQKQPTPEDQWARESQAIRNIKTTTPALPTPPGRPLSKELWEAFSSPAFDIGSLVDNPPSSPWQAGVRGFLKGAQALTSPAAVATAVGLGGLGALGRVGAGIETAATGLFTGMAAKGAYDAGKAGYDRWKSGDVNGAAEAWGMGSADGLFSALMARATYRKLPGVASDIRTAWEAWRKTGGGAAPAPSAPGGTPEGPAAPPEGPETAAKPPGAEPARVLQEQRIVDPQTGKTTVVLTEAQGLDPAKANSLLDQIIDDHDKLLTEITRQHDTAKASGTPLPESPATAMDEETARALNGGKLPDWWRPEGATEGTPPPTETTPAAAGKPPITTDPVLAAILESHGLPPAETPPQEIPPPTPPEPEPVPVTPPPITRAESVSPDTRRKPEPEPAGQGAVRLEDLNDEPPAGAEDYRRALHEVEGDLAEARRIAESDEYVTDQDWQRLNDIGRRYGLPAVYAGEEKQVVDAIQNWRDSLQENIAKLEPDGMFTPQAGPTAAPEKPAPPATAEVPQVSEPVPQVPPTKPTTAAPTLPETAPPPKPESKKPGIDAWMPVYEKHLRRLAEAGEYSWPAANVPTVAAKMREALLRGTYNHDSKAFKATAKELGIKNTQKAIEEFLSKPPAEAAKPEEKPIEPWQFTAQEYSDREADIMGQKRKPVSQQMREWHKGKVRDAERRGEPVPANVLAEYETKPAGKPAEPRQSFDFPLPALRTKDGRKVTVLGYADQFEPYKSDAERNELPPERELMKVQYEDGSTALMLGSSILDAHGKPLLPEIPQAGRKSPLEKLHEQTVAATKPQPRRIEHPSREVELGEALDAPEAGMAAELRKNIHENVQILNSGMHPIGRPLTEEERDALTEVIIQEQAVLEALETGAKEPTIEPEVEGEPDVELPGTEGGGTPEGAPPETVRGPRKGRKPRKPVSGDVGPVHQPTGRPGGEESPIQPSPGTGATPGIPAGPVRPASPRRKSPAPDLSRDLRLTAQDAIGEGNLRLKAQQNIDAIRLMKQIQAENRPAAPEEQRVLAKFTGWGALSQLFRPYEYQVPAEWRTQWNEVKELLTEDEWKAASGSTVNAHYTSPLVIAAMWDALRRLGMQGGERVLEPSMGVGNFFGFMPEDLLKNGTTRTGIELDTITGGIAKLLYPGSNVHVAGFQNVPLSNNFFDVAISNVPFGNYPVADPEFRKENYLTNSIHNYFFAKGLKKVREGGVVAFITSSYTMDSKDPSIRKYLSDNADLLGAIRLPDTAFKGNAGTSVTTDIIFLRKRKPGTPPAGEPWVEVQEGVKMDDKRRSYSTGQIDGHLNEYYVKHPEMMLGTMAITGSQWENEQGLTGTLTPEALAAAIENLPKGILEKAEVIQAEEESDLPPPIPLSALPSSETVKDGGFTFQNGQLYVREGTELKPANITGKDADRKIARIRGMLTVRNAWRNALIAQEEKSEEEAERARKQLNQAYDAFHAAYGPLNSKPNVRAFAGDPDAPGLISLEHYDDKTKKARKAAIFSQRTNTRYVPPETEHDAARALAIALNEYGGINWPRLRQLTGMEQTDLEDLLIQEGLVFQNPDGGKFETADEYLSGNVRAKLKEAIAAAESDPRYEHNVESLKRVIPEDLKPGDIDARLGANWVPKDVIAQFIAEKLHVHSVKVGHAEAIASWVISGGYGDGNATNQTEFGHGKFTGVDLVEMAMNLKAPTIKWEDDEGKTHTDPEATAAAREKQQKLKDLFRKWIWEDAERATRLARLYNDRYNNIRLRQFDGSHLQFPGMAAGINLRQHQKNAIWRMLQGGNSLLAHVVGAGKTWAMATAAMEMRRIGQAKKPMFVVPNHLVQQWAAEFLQLYPSANLFVAGKDTFAQGKRQTAMSRIANGNYDAVIVSHTSFGKLPVKDSTYLGWINEQIKELEDAIYEAAAAEGKKGPTVKELEKAKRRLEAKLEKRSKRETKDVTINFEDMGIDQLFVDEAHMFKNLYFLTKMTRIAGIPNTESDRAIDMYLKTRWLTQKRGGKGVVFATGTPISNTMAEMFTMMRYLQEPYLKDVGLGHFDAWAQNYGEGVTSLELAPDGSGYRMNTRFCRFVNLPELATAFRVSADVQTADMLKLPTPALKGGKPIIVASPSSDDLKRYVESLVARAEAIKGKPPEKGGDNMLKITGDGRKAALDMRLVPGPALEPVPFFEQGTPENRFALKAGTRIQFKDPNMGKIFDGTVSKDYDGTGEGDVIIYAKDRADWPVRRGLILQVYREVPRTIDPNGKVSKSAERIQEIWERTKEQRSTQLVFCDLSTPREEGFDVYNELKRKLVDSGIPPEEIAFIHDYDTDAKKKALFDKVNSGDVRILMGSTEKMGAGMNVQKKLIALHHLDAPWRPSDIEQREGRILRQGNENAEVEIYRYVTEGSFDAYMWQTLEAKARFIAQVMRGDVSVRTAEDVEGAALTYAEIKGIASGNPKVVEKIKVDIEVRRLDALRSEYNNQLYDIRRELAALPEGARGLEEAKARAQADWNRYSNSPDVWELDGETFEGKDAAKRAGERLHQLLAADRDLYQAHNDAVNAMRAEASKQADAIKADESLSDYKKRKLLKELDQKFYEDVKTAPPYTPGRKLGTYRGFEIHVGAFSQNNIVDGHLIYGLPDVSVQGENHYHGSTNQEGNPQGTLQSINYKLRTIDEDIASLDQAIARATQKQRDLQALLEKPFEHEQRLNELLRRQEELNNELDLNKNQTGTEGEEQGEQTVEKAQEPEEDEGEEESAPLYIDPAAPIDWGARAERLHNALRQQQAKAEPDPEKISWLEKLLRGARTALWGEKEPGVRAALTYKGVPATLGEKLSRVEAVYRPGKKGKPGTVYLNKAAADVLAAQLKLPQRLAGLTIPSGHLKRIIWNLRAGRSDLYSFIARGQGFNRRWSGAEVMSRHEGLIDALDAALVNDGAAVVVQTGVPGLRGTLRHERFHITQNDLDEHLGGREDELLSHPVGRKMRRALLALGYKDDPEEIAFEIGAVLAAGQYDELGLTRQEAKAIWFAYTTILGEVHGANALQKIDGIAPLMKGVLVDVQEIIAQREADEREPEARDLGGEEGEAGLRPGVRPSLSREERPLASLLAGTQRGASALVRSAAETVISARDDIRKAVNPYALSPEAEQAGLSLRQHLGRSAQSFARAERALEPARIYFAGRPWDENLDFINRVEMGDPQPTPQFQQIADVMREILDSHRTAVQRLGKGKLTQFYVNYFPHIWKKSQAAEGVFRAIFGKRPLEGPKAFLKKRKFQSFQEGVDAKLEPVSTNPVDLVLLKAKEMERYIAAHRFLNEMKANGLAKYVPSIGARKRPPDGWVKIPDSVGTVWGPPFLQVPEAHDKQFMDTMFELARNLGIKQERVAKLRGAWGRAYKGQNLTRTRFAGPESVLLHEIGHQLDWKYNLLGAFQAEAKKQKSFYTFPGAWNETYQREMRNLADLRLVGNDTKYFQQYVRRGEEKMANMVAAYGHAPERFKQVAPHVFQWFDSFVKSHPALEPLTRLRYGMQLQVDTTEYPTGGFVQLGNYYMPPGAAQLLSNYLSPGLQFKPYYRMLRSTSNLMLQFSLGFSAFHAAFVINDAATSRLALALQYLMAGKPIEAAKLGNPASIAYAPIANLRRGARIRDAYLSRAVTDPELKKYVAAIVAGGGRVEMDAQYRSNMKRAFMDAWRRRAAGSVALSALPALAELVVWPVLEWMVPRMKLGVFADNVDFELKRLGPNASQEDVRKAFAGAWDSVDNRMGQLVYDDLFWSRSVKDIAMLTVQSVGWNLGTIREFGGAIHDVVRAPGRIIRGRIGGAGPTPPPGAPTGAGATGGGPRRPSDPAFTRRMAYSIAAMMLTGTIGAFWNYFATRGRRNEDGSVETGIPRDWRDVYFPKSGNVDESGRDERIALWGYIKDLVAWYEEPRNSGRNKLSPILRFLAETFWANRNFYNEKLWNGEDRTIPENIRVELEHLAGFFVPMSVSGMMRERRRGAPAGMQIGQFLGLRSAPTYINRTDAEQAMAENFAETRSNTSNATERTKAKREIVQALRSRDYDRAINTAEEALKVGRITEDDLKRIVDRAASTPLISDYSRLDVHDAIRVYGKATEKERRQILPLLDKKLRTIDKLPANEQEKVLHELARAGLIH